MPQIAAFPKCYLDDIASGQLPLLKWIEMATALGAEGLEMYSRFPELQPGGDVAAVDGQLNEAGFEMPMMCHSPDFTIPDVRARQVEVEEQKRVIGVTATLGGQFCRVLSGQRRNEVTRDQGVSWVVDCVEQCLPVAEECGVALVIENHYKDGFWRFPEFAQKMDVFLEIVERIESPHFGVQYDPSNAIVAGDDPIELLSRCVHRVRTMHASDRYLAEGATLDDLRAADGTIGYTDKLLHGVTGEGLNDYGVIFSILKEAGFDGWVSIEDGMNGMDEMKQSVDFLKAMREKHFGAAS